MIPNNLYPNLQQGLQPLSAGTYVSYICAICHEDGIQVATQIPNTPHPVYTNGFGRAIVQTQMVELGGMNGVNS